ncbi:MAG: GIY-YIG nuclease family protein [Patescibacteria group bacterium]|nr:GIY-YIG nuclease family protein [Patescibacteria group bacterium]
MYYTYVLKSKKTKKLYVGQAEDLRKRFCLHNKGLVKSTKNGIPWQLIYYEACLIKADSIKREKQLKTGFGRAYLNRRIFNIKD